MPLLIGIALLLLGIHYLDETGSRTVGAVLLGAGIAVAVEGYRSVLDEARRIRERKDAAEARRRQDLDETRRLLYMAISLQEGNYIGSPEIAGTVANALAHHSRKLSRKDAEALARGIATGQTPNLAYVDLAQKIIDGITVELGDAAPDESVHESG